MIHLDLFDLDSVRSGAERRKILNQRGYPD